VVSEKGNILFELDCHKWTEYPQPCAICSYSKKEAVQHFMVCSICALRRYGPLACHGNYHYFEYGHPDGVKSEYIPPCKIEPPPDIGVIDVVRVCNTCGSNIDHFPSGDCHQPGSNNYQEIKFCRRLKW